MNITIKFGFSDDCVKIREEVFVDEQGFKEEFDEVDKSAVHIVIYDGETPIATGRTFADDTDSEAYHIGRVAVIKEYRDKHIGSMVVSALEDKAKQLGAKRFELSSQLRVVEFYKTLGYNPVGDTYYDQHCEHQAMLKTI